MRWALLRVAIYLVTLVPFVLIYGTKDRALVVAPPIAFLGAAGTWILLRVTDTSVRERLLYSAGVGMVLGELTWALEYWTVLPLVGGATLWLAFYVLSGVAEHGLSGTLDRRITLEYAGVSALGLLIVLASQPWRV